MKQDMSAASDTEKKVQAKPTKPEKPEKSKKNLYEPYATPSVLYNMLRWVVIIVFSLAARIHLRERYNVPKKGPFIIAANHLSWTDIPLVPAYLPGKVIYMAKEEAFYSQVGWLVRFLGAFPVKRGEADRQALRAADEQLKKGKVMIIFPEGTRSKTRTLAKGHAGLAMIALRAGVPVVPVAIWGSEKVLKKFRPSVTIAYGKPIMLKPKGAKVTREDVDAGTEEIMRRIAEMLPTQYRGVYTEEMDMKE